jgi:hypothetical protein
LSSAFQKYGFIPIPIALRDFASIPIPKLVPENWLFDLVARRFDSVELGMDDEGLLKSILKSGYFILVLDGANEIEDHGAIQLFARRYPNIGLLVTSQSENSIDVENFETWRLPPNIRDSMFSLLKHFLGDRLGRTTYDAIESSSIKAEIQSGYDVRLLADLVEDGSQLGSIPTSRLGLYDSMLDKVKIKVSADYPTADLCKVAWVCWSAGRRDLVIGDNVSRNLIMPLQIAGVHIVRIEHGKIFVFRHDQMRGYLAARWVALHEVSPIDLFESNPEIWRVARADQQIVWDFFAELIPQDVGRKVLAWATLEAERAELQVALRRIAKRDVWDVGV